MEERDSLRTMLYCWARFGLFWLINIFAAIMSRTVILGIVGTLIPRLSLYENPLALSFISWLIPVALLTWLFIDDAKRHTAYGRYNPVAVELVMLLTGIVYYIPVFLLDYIDSKSAIASITSLYFPSFWLSKISDDPQVYGLIGALIQVVLCIASYLIAHKYYLKKFLEEEEEEEENE